MLSARARRRHFPTGASLMDEGRPGSEVMLIDSGRVKVMCRAIDGREIVLDFRGPGELLGEMSAIDGTRVRAGSRRSSRWRAGRSRHRRSRRWSPSPRASPTPFSPTSSGDSGTPTASGSSSAPHTPIGRVAARLVEMVERFGTLDPAGYVIDLPISQEELAGWTGASREAVAKALHTLRELGLITTERRRFTVLDLEGLGTALPLPLSPAIESGKPREHPARHRASRGAGQRRGAEPAGSPAARVTEGDPGARDGEVRAVAVQEHRPVAR